MVDRDSLPSLQICQYRREKVVMKKPSSPAVPRADSRTSNMIKLLVKSTPSMTILYVRISRF